MTGGKPASTKLVYMQEQIHLDS